MLSSVIEAIGNTPLVELSRFTENLDGRILAKLDYLNPGFSKKDRIAKQMVEDAEKSGALKPGQTVVELTSGNTGTGLAIVCAVKGYPFVAVMSRGNSIERARMMAALGAEVILVDQLPDSEPGKVSGGDLDFRAHYLHTGPEFLRQSHFQIEAFCDFPGTGGSFSGCAAAFKEYDSEIQCYIVEPEGAAVLAGKPVTDPNHPIQGGGYSMPALKFINPDQVDGYLQVSDDEAINTARSLAKKEGIFAGFSSGANVAAAVQLLEGKQKGSTVAVIMNDSGLKYLSTDLWE